MKDGNAFLATAIEAIVYFFLAIYSPGLTRLLLEAMDSTVYLISGANRGS